MGFHAGGDDNWMNKGHRIPFTKWMNRDVKNHLVAASGEYVGTVLFLYFAFAGTQVANNSSTTGADTTSSDISRVLFISLAFGFSLAVNAWVFLPHIWRALQPSSLYLLVSQLFGGMTAAALVSCMFPGPPSFKSTLSQGTSVAQGLFIEMFLTAMLMLTIFMLAAEKTKATFLAPIGIGLSLFIAELAGVFYTGGSLNPARSFGPCVATRSFETYHYIYWIGPCLGALIATGFYKFLTVLEYEAANPGQDDSGQTAVLDLGSKEQLPDLETGLADRIITVRSSNSRGNAS